MRRESPRRLLAVYVLAAAGLCAAAATAWAHCDTLDGPVVKASRKALETGDVDLVLIWVQKKDEPEIRAAFRKTVAVRRAGPEARELADMYFFETLVRVHRAGEGAPYTGLKPAGAALGPAIPAADKALETGTAEPLVKLLTEAVHAGLHPLLKDAVSRRSFPKADLEAGRAYVKAYVEYVHFVERLFEAAKGPVEGHFPEAAAGHVREER